MKKLLMKIASGYKPSQVWLLPLLAIGLLMRISYIYFVFKTGEYPAIFLNNDSFSFTQSFINWWETGQYTFDNSHPDARFGRLPGYPMFWGIHYLVFGSKYVYISVAATQSLLDTLLIYMLYQISVSIGGSVKTSLIVSFLYAFNPFVVFWVPITGTESLAVFLTVLFFYILMYTRQLKYHTVAVAFIGGMAFYVRPYLALLIISAITYLVVNQEKEWLKKCLVICVCFIVCLSLWPIRNYLVSGEVILVKTASSGYYRYAPDVSACRKYLFTWTTEFDYYMDEVFLSDNEISLPPEAIPQGFDSEAIVNTIKQARNCGSGFQFWEDGFQSLEINCDKQIAKEFESYRLALYEEHPIRSHLLIPAYNLKKILFKQRRLKPTYPILEGIFFTLRTVAVILGLYGLFLGIRNKSPSVISIGVFTLLMYILIAYIVRQVEMRYLLQVDVVLLPVVAYVLSHIQRKTHRSIKLDS